MAMSFSDIQRTVGQLIFSDPRVLRSAGLQRLGEHFDAYPIRLAGQNVCILIRRGLTPRKAGAMAEADVAANVLVLEINNGKWKRAWPVADQAVSAG